MICRMTIVSDVGGEQARAYAEALRRHGFLELDMVEIARIVGE